MQLGSTPATAVLMTRARGLNPSSSRIGRAATASAAAPSLIPLELPAVTVSVKDRTGWTLWLSEAVATFGLVLVVRTAGRRGRVAETALAVAAFVGAAMLFTASTCFANPAVTLARTLTDTFAGIAPASTPAFILAQLVGGAVGLALAVWLTPQQRPAVTVRQADLVQALPDR